MLNGAKRQVNGENNLQVTQPTAEESAANG